MLRNTGRLVEAGASFWQAIEFALGDRDGARRALAEAVRLRPDDAELKRRLQAVQGP